MKRCDRCNAEIKRSWNYCPFCGSKISRVKKFVEFGVEDIFERMLESIDSTFRWLLTSNPEPQKKQHVLKIKITPAHVDVMRENDPRKKDRISGEHVVKSSHEPSTTPKAVVEPEAEIKRQGSEITITLKMPGIKDERDVELIRLEESAEIRARVKDKMYFKILDIPKSFTLKEKSVSKDRLMLRFSLC